MTTHTHGIALQRADRDALEYVETLLARNGLPTADVRANADAFYVVRDDDRRVGIGGLERHGPAGLLRSVVVEDPARGEGVGTAICDALEARAAADGIETLYVLTTTAEAFFAGRGYERIDRDEAPESIRETDEFGELCPETATCMRKTL